MSGQLIGGVIGAAIGFVVAGPAGLSVGWALGGVAGGIVDPTRVQGPRLSDTKVQVSTYGAAIPVYYGGYAGAGNIIWSTDLIEHDSDEGGKGGSVTNVASYSVSFALLIGEGLIEGIRRIWFDAKCVYDISDTADGPALAASALLAQYFTFYKGTEDQLPDPTMEGVLGVGNVPAYLGYSYLVFADLPLADYGNRIPNIRIETSFEAVPVTPETGTTWEPLKIYDWVVTAHGPEHSIPGYTTWNVGANFNNYPAALAYLQANPPVGREFFAYCDTYVGFATSLNHNWSPFPDGAKFGPSDDSESSYLAIVYSAAVPYTLINSGGGFLYCTTIQAFGAMPDDGNFYWTRDSVNIDSSGGIGQLVSDYTAFSSSNPQYGVGNNCLGYPAVDGSFPTFAVLPIATISVKRELAPPPNKPGCQPGDPCALGSAQVPGNPNFCIDCAGNVTPRVSITYEVVTVDNPSGTTAGQYHQLAVQVFGSFGSFDQAALGPLTVPGDPRHNDFDFWAAQYDLAVGNGTLDPAHSAGRGNFYGVNQAAKGTVSSVPIDVADEGGTTLDVIVADVCKRAGMTTDEIDVTALVGIPVWGYCVARQMPARQALLPLQQVFWWDFVESGRKIKAVLRGAVPALTIGVDDLGASDTMDSAVAVVPNRGQESELPATVNVTYPVRASGYENGTQYARRVTTGSKQVLSFEVAVAMSDTKAAQVPDVLMYATWTERTTRTWQTTRKYAANEPTDVLTLDDGEFEYVVRITDRSEEQALIKWTGVDEKPAAYSPVVEAASGAGGSAVGVRFDGPTKLELIDAPLLQDTDDQSGVYAAVAGYRDSWSGGGVYKSRDAGTTYARVRSVTRKGVIGYATTVLGTYAGGNTVDEINAVTVRMHAGELAGITRAQLLNNGNAAILAGEVLQFLRAELVSPGVYRLSGLLRGRLGTEPQQAGHAANDRFVLLTPETLYRFPMNLDEVGLPEKWKAASFGQTVEDANAIDFTDTGASLKPLSPVHLAAVPDPATPGNCLARWTRRTRVGGIWRDGIDVPIGETVEAYDVELSDSAGVVIASQTVSSPQTSIGGDALSSLVLAEALDYVREAAGTIVGAIDTYPVENAISSARQLNATTGANVDGLGLASGADVGGVQAVLAVGDQVYYAFNRGGNVSRVVRIDSTVHTWTIAATYACADAAFGRGLAYDGTNIWISDGPNLVKVDPTTLVAAGTYAVGFNGEAQYDAGSIWVCGYNGFAQFDIATTTVVQSVTSDVLNIAGIRVAGSFVFVCGSVEIGVYDKSTGALIGKTPGGYYTLGRNGFGTLPGYVIAADIPGQRILYFSTATGAVVRTRPVPGLWGVAGSAIGSLFVAVRTPSSDPTGYSMSTLVYGGALTGSTLTVWQRSNAVGRGFPASITL